MRKSLIQMPKWAKGESGQKHTIDQAITRSPCSFTILSLFEMCKQRSERNVTIKSVKWVAGISCRVALMNTVQHNNVNNVANFQIKQESRVAVAAAAVSRLELDLYARLFGDKSSMSKLSRCDLSNYS